MAEPRKRETNTMTKGFLEAFTRNLGILREEIEAYEDEANLWKVAGDIKNSGGNLCLHLVGNLNHFIGANIGKTGYVRERDREFSDKGVSREELLKRVDEVTETVKSTLGGMTDDSLAAVYEDDLFQDETDTGTVLAYMSGHLSYHLGQLNYHRRLLDG